MAALLFLGLNIADAYLTKSGILMGAVEANSLAIHFGSSLIAKGLIAVLIIIGLYWFRKEESLWWMNFIVLAAVLWNSMQCVILHVFCGIPWPV